MANQVEKYPCEVVESADGALTLIPMNDKARDLLNTFFTDHGSNTTVAITQGDAERSGYGDTNTQPYSTLILTTTA